METAIFPFPRAGTARISVQGLRAPGSGGAPAAQRTVPPHRHAYYELVLICAELVSMSTGRWKRPCCPGISSQYCRPTGLPISGGCGALQLQFYLDAPLGGRDLVTPGSSTTSCSGTGTRIRRHHRQH